MRALARLASRLALTGVLFGAPAFAQNHGEAHAGEHGQTHTDAAEVRGHSEAQEHGALHEHHELDPINWWNFYGKDSEGKPQIPMVALFINFALLMWLYVRVGKKPIQEALKNRRKEIGNSILHARRLLKEAKDRAKSYQGQLANLEEDVAGAKSALREAGLGDKQRIVSEAHEKAERLERDATFLLEQERKQMRDDLVRETVERAVLAAENLLKTGITQRDQDRLAEDFLSQIAVRRSGGTLPPPAGTSVPPAPRGSLAPASGDAK